MKSCQYERRSFALEARPALAGLYVGRDAIGCRDPRPSGRDADDLDDLRSVRAAALRTPAASRGAKARSATRKRS
jgi:hypothetical protein